MPIILQWSNDNEYISQGDAEMNPIKRLMIIRNAMRMNRSARTLTPMQRVIQRIAFRHLKAMGDADFNQIATQLVWAGVNGVGENAVTEAYQMPLPEGVTHYNFAPIVVKMFSGMKLQQGSEISKEDFMQDMMMAQPNPLIKAGHGVAAKIPKGMSAVDAWPSLMRVVGGYAKRNMKNHLINKLKLERNKEVSMGQLMGDEESYGDTQDRIVNPDMGAEFTAIRDPNEDAIEVTTIILKGKRNSYEEEIMYKAMPFLASRFAALFQNTKTHGWIEAWFASRFHYILQSGTAWEKGKDGRSTFGALREGLTFLESQSPKDFRKMAAWYQRSDSSPLTVRRERGDLIVNVGMKKEKRMAAEQARFLVTFASGGKGAISKQIYRAKKKDGICQVYKASRDPAAPKGSSTEVITTRGRERVENYLDRLWIINVQSGSSEIAKKLLQVPHIINDEYNRNAAFQKAVYPMLMARDQTNPRFAKNKKAQKATAEAKKNKPTNVPF